MPSASLWRRSPCLHASDNADFLIAAANTALDVSLVPTLLNQRRDKASTIPLTTSVTSTALWLFTALTFASISLWITMAASIVTASIWAIIAFQRFVYGDPATPSN